MTITYTRLSDRATVELFCSPRGILRLVVVRFTDSGLVEIDPEFATLDFYEDTFARTLTQD